MYEDYKLYGPYQANDGRLRVVLVNKDTKEKKTISYPKYLMECHLKRHLDDNETIDHIDGDPLNNDLNNLRVLNRQEHCYNDAYRNKDITVTCTYCHKEFIILGNKISDRNRFDRNNSGYFCSKQCSGKYGAEIQYHKRKPKKVKKVKPEKFRLHKSAKEETL